MGLKEATEQFAPTIENIDFMSGFNKLINEAKQFSFKAGAEWQKEQFQPLIKMFETLLYYSQIHTVHGVQPVNMETHEITIKNGQKWLWDNCIIQDGEYVLKS